jgi:hypothetical protein
MIEGSLPCTNGSGSGSLKTSGSGSATLWQGVLIFIWPNFAVPTEKYEKMRKCPVRWLGLGIIAHNGMIDFIFVNGRRGSLAGGYFTRNGIPPPTPPTAAVAMWGGGGGGVVVPASSCWISSRVEPSGVCCVVSVTVNLTISADGEKLPRWWLYICRFRYPSLLLSFFSCIALWIRIRNFLARSDPEPRPDLTFSSWEFV